MNSFQYHRLPWVRAVRSRARSWGMVRLLRRLVGQEGAHPEEAFQRALKASIRPNDTVWDVGANIGHYTLQFLEWVGPTGKVVAFEPLPAAFRRLEASLHRSPYPRDRYLLYQVALTDQDGEVQFLEEPTDGEAVSTLAHIVDRTTNIPEDTVTVRAFQVDSSAGKGGNPVPHVTKIDVEGNEEEVLIGCAATLSNPSHRELFIEDHFTRLTERAKDDGPARIVKLLRDWNYRIKWLDASHLWASRSKP